MKNSRKIRRRLVSGILAVSFSVVAALPQALAASDSVSRQLARQTAGLNRLSALAAKVLPNGTVTIADGSLVYVGVDELLTESTLIATGKITGESLPFEVRHATDPEATRIYTDSYFTITNVLKGDPSAETVSVRLAGGTIGDRTEVWSGSPIFNQEDEYLLFLYKPGYGGTFETQDDYYLIRGLVQGVYVQTEEGTFVNCSSGEELPGDALISPHMDETMEEDYFRNQLLETYRGNYERGMDSLEEYEENVRSLDQYASIVKRED